MKSISEIREELKDIKLNSNTTDGTEDILTGWIEALEWVLTK